MLFAVVALYGNIHIFKARKEIRDTRLGSYMEACCLWMFFLFFVTEILSVFHGVRFRILLPVWVLFDVLLLFFLAVQWRKAGWSIPKKLVEIWRSSGRRIGEAPYYGLLFVLGAVVLALSLITTPYNWDSMTYHLPRIAYWAQNRSVEHYATNCIRQIASPVLAEFVNLHVYILCRRNDLFFNLLQGISYLTCGVLVGGIAKKISCNRFFCFLAMLLYMSMPIAYAEALTTQVDNFAAVWMLFFAYRLLDYTDSAKPMRFDGITVCRIGSLGLCVAWGYLAKPSVCIGMVCFALWLLIVCIRRKDRMRDLVRLFLCAMPCVALPMMPEILRNFKTFHSYASAAAGARQLVGTLKPSYLFVNLLKNLSFNMPITLIRDADIVFREIAVKAALFLGVKLDAASISEDGREYGLHAAPDYGCDTAVNPVILWLFLFCVLWTIWRIVRRQWEEEGRGYFLAAMSSFIVFCTVLRWEPFVSRYMISYLALLCPTIAAQIQHRTRQKRARPLRWCIAVILCCLCVSEAFNISRYHYDIWKNRGAATRPYGYFGGRWDEMAIYISLTDYVTSRGYENVGLHLLKLDDYEYPLWKMLNGCHLEHIQVENESAVYAEASFVPDCIIWFGELPEGGVKMGGGRRFDRVTEFGEREYLLETVSALSGN